VDGIKTRQLLALLGNAPYHRVANALRNGKITPPPAKDVSGDFMWAPDDVERARQALARDGRKDHELAREGKAVTA
jgi:hypothetical protein